jgi:hypothetical protein
MKTILKTIKLEIKRKQINTVVNKISKTKKLINNDRL